MQDHSSLCADILAAAPHLSGQARTLAQLAWVARLCDAAAACLALRDGDGRLQPCVGWPDATLRAETDHTTLIEIGSVEGSDAVLLLTGKVPSSTVTAGLRALSPALCLILELHLARTAVAETTAQHANATLGCPEPRAQGADTPMPRAALDRLWATRGTPPDMVFEMTDEGRYMDVLAGPPDVMAIVCPAVPGRRLHDLLPPDQAAALWNDLRQTLETGQSAAIRYQLATPQGTRWFERTGVRKDVPGPGGEPTALFVVRDITDDRRQGEDLGRLSRIVETMSNMVVIIDADRRITWANRAWEQRTGWPLETVRGRVLGDLVRGADDDHGSAARVAAAMQRGEAYKGETVNIDAHGNRYWVDFNILPLHDDHQRITGYVSVETDITAQRESAVRAAHLAIEADRMRARLFNAIETLPDSVIIWDENNHMVVANSAYRRMYPEVADVLVEGVSQETILRIGIAKKAFPGAIGREAAWLAEQHERYLNPVVDEVVRYDGTWIRRLDLRTADGGRIAVRIDTTERHRQLDALDAANRSLAEARQSLAQIIESANVGTWDWRLDDGTQRNSDRYATMLGYTPQEIGETWESAFHSLVHPEDFARLCASEEEDFAHPPQGDEPVREHQLRMRRKDGSWAWILSRSAATERRPDGRHKRVVGIHLDITEQKQLADEVATSRAFLNEVMDASIAAIVVMDVAGVITYANAEAERILGLDRSVIEGRRYDDPGWRISAPDGTPLPPDELPFRRAMTAHAVIRDLRMAIAWPDGTRRILSVNVVPHVGVGDIATPNLVITSFIDITDDLAKAERLEHALEQAQAASRSKSTFLANMSHEIRTPLNGVLGMAELLDEMITEPGQKQMIGTIRRSGELLLNVLNEVLDMSKIEAGKMVVEHIPFVPAEIARQIEPLHALRAREKGLELTVLTNPGAECARLGDPFRIQQIMNNLLSNAIKFTERGFVALTVCAQHDRTLVIEVRDTGIGMTTEQTSRIFDNFEQAESGTTRRFGGTGLGMTIVRSLIRLMAGDIAITSTLGIGTAVRITLPLEEAASPLTPDTSLPDLVGTMSLAGVRLLVADDSATNRLVLRAMLRESGAIVVTANNGAEAVSEWSRLVDAGTPADMLLLDISMPVLDGIGALAAIRASGTLGERVVALAVTANAMSHHVAEYIAAGFDAHLPKPYKRAELLKALTLARRER